MEDDVVASAMVEDQLVWWNEVKEPWNWCVVERFLQVQVM